MNKAQIISIISAFVSGGTLVRYLVYVSKCMPALPAGSGWWKQFFYALVKNTSGLDPSATIINPPKPQ